MPSCYWLNEEEEEEETERAWATLRAGLPYRTAEEAVTASSSSRTATASTFFTEEEEEENWRRRHIPVGGRRRARTSYGPQPGTGKEGAAAETTQAGAAMTLPSQG